MAVSGVASMYQTSDWSLAPGRHGYQRAGELIKGSGPLRGYSTYTFDDGSSITASFTGEVTEGLSHGLYTILSGTGAYANATGAGSFDGIRVVVNAAAKLSKLDTR